MYLNEFAEGVAPRDLTTLEEFESLLQSAADLRIPHSRNARYRSANTVVRHQRFHYLEWGEPGRPPVLLLHGGNQSAHSWDLVSLHLSDRYHVLALDQRGHGDSEWSRECDYSVEAMAHDAVAFLRDRGVARPVIFGHSMGGMVSLMLAKLHPEVPRALVIVDVGPEISERGTSMIRDFVQRNVEFDDLGEFLDHVERYDPFRSRAHMARTVKYNLLRRADGKYVSKTDRRRFPPDTSATSLGRVSLEDVRRFPCPTLVVRGAMSSVLEADAAQRFAAALSHGHLVTIAACGHNVHSQNTPGFLAGIAPFLAEVDAAR
jgi:pimeloyl-ACP methyl ester carboxylesterase